MLVHAAFLDFNALILTHGVLELSALCIAGGSDCYWLGCHCSGPMPPPGALQAVAPDAFGLLPAACFCSCSLGSSRPTSPRISPRRSAGVWRAGQPCCLTATSPWPRMGKKGQRLQKTAMRQRFLLPCRFPPGRSASKRGLIYSTNICYSNPRKVTSR